MSESNPEQEHLQAAGEELPGLGFAAQWEPQGQELSASALQGVQPPCPIPEQHPWAWGCPWSCRGVLSAGAALSISGRVPQQPLPRASAPSTASPPDPAPFCGLWDGQRGHWPPAERNSIFALSRCTPSKRNFIPTWHWRALSTQPSVVFRYVPIRPPLPLHFCLPHVFPPASSLPWGGLAQDPLQISVRCPQTCLICALEHSRDLSFARLQITQHCLCTG